MDILLPNSACHTEYWQSLPCTAILTYFLQLLEQIQSCLLDLCVLLTFFSVGGQVGGCSERAQGCYLHSRRKDIQHGECHTGARCTEPMKSICPVAAPRCPARALRVKAALSF